VLDQNLYDWAPLVIFLPSLAFLADWTLTLAGARAYRTISHRWSVEGSYEMNPAWEAAVDSGKWLNARVIAVAVVFLAALAALWLATLAFETVDGAALFSGPAIFAFAAGTLLLVQVPTLMNHAANLQQFRVFGDPSAANGQIRIARWVALNQTGWFYLRFAVLWLILGVASFQAFFLGGALGCLVIGLRFRRLGNSAGTEGSEARVGEFNVDALRAHSESNPD